MKVFQKNPKTTQGIEKQLEEYIKSAIVGQQGFTLEGLADLVIASTTIKDQANDIFKHFSAHLDKYDVLLNLIALKSINKKIDIVNDFSNGTLSQLLKTRYKFIAFDFYAEHLYPHVKKLMLIVIHSLPDDFTSLAKELDSLLKEYLDKFVLVNIYPVFLKRELCLIDRWLTKAEESRNLAAPNHTGILLNHILSFFYEIILENFTILSSNAIVTEKGNVISVEEYKSKFLSVLEEVFFSTLKNLIELPDQAKQNSKNTSLIEWRKNAVDTMGSIYKPKLKEFIEKLMKNISMNHLEVLTIKNELAERIDRTEGLQQFTKKEEKDSSVPKLKKSFPNTFRKLRESLHIDKRHSTPNEFEKEYTTTLSDRTVAYNEKDSNQPTPKQIQESITTFTIALKTMANEIQNVKETANFILKKIDLIKKILNYRDPLSNTKKLQTGAKEKFGSNWESGQAIINEKCLQLLKEYDVGIPKKNTKQSREEQIKNLVIVCYLAPNLLLEEFKLRINNPRKQGNSNSEISYILFHYYQPIKEAFEFTFIEEKTTLKNYCEQLEKCLQPSSASKTQPSNDSTLENEYNNQIS